MLWSQAASGLCENKTLEALRSPDASHTAYLFERDCGATTGVSHQVSIMPDSDRLPNQAGNIFVADRQDTKPQLHWTGARTLEIRHKKTARTFKLEKHRDGINVAYVVTD